MNPADHFPQILSGWENPKTGTVDWSVHQTRKDAVEEAGEAKLRGEFHRYVGSLFVTYQPIAGVTCPCAIDLSDEAAEYEAEAQQDARIRTRDAA